VPVMYILGRELFTPAAGLAAAFLAAVLPFHIYFAQEARPTPSLSFFRPWCYGFLFGPGSLPAMDSGQVLGYWQGAVSMLTTFDLPVGCVSRVCVAGQPREKYRWRGLLLSDFIITLIFVPRLSLAWTQTYRVTTDFWVSIPSPLQPIKTLVFFAL